MIVYVPVRIDFIGGWSDQLQWPYESAVINASVGWEGGYLKNYPLCVDKDGFHSIIRGVGTGLGISSIKRAAEIIYENPKSKINRTYISKVLEWEKKELTLGGWQDQMGAVESGFKIITSGDHKNFEVKNLQNKKIFDHLVLFDTGIRRQSRMIGDKVRMLFCDPKFVKCLKKVVSEAKNIDVDNAEVFSKVCIKSWKRLDKMIRMDVGGLPTSELMYGYKLVGAGLGGYGIAFVKNSNNVDEVIEMYKFYKICAVRPKLLDGVLVV